MTDAELETLAEAADYLGERVVRAPAEGTGRRTEDLDVDPDDHEFPEPDPRERLSRTVVPPLARRRNLVYLSSSNRPVSGT